MSAPQPQETPQKDAHIWARIEKLRSDLSGDLSSLTPAQWSSPSLCQGWSVRDLVAHMTATANSDPKNWFADFAKAKFNFNELMEQNIRRYRGTTSEQTLAEFNASIHNRTSPPGPVISWLGEALIHAEDIRRPLGFEHRYDREDLLMLAEFYKNSNLVIGSKKRIKGLKLYSTDIPWSHGKGAEVRGPLLSLVMAMTGRKEFLRDLEGEGVAILRERD